MFCSSKQNRFSIMANDGVGVVMTLMKMNALQFCFELQCNCWKLLTMMMETMLDNGCDQVCEIQKYILIEQSIYCMCICVCMYLYCPRRVNLLQLCWRYPVALPDTNCPTLTTIVCWHVLLPAT